MLDLSDAELELFDRSARGDAELGAEPRNRRAGRLAHPRQLAAPAVEHVCESGTRLCPIHAETARELVGELVDSIGSQDEGTDPGEREGLQRPAPGATGFVHEASRRAAACGVPVSTWLQHLRVRGRCGGSRRRSRDTWALDLDVFLVALVGLVGLIQQHSADGLDSLERPEVVTPPCKLGLPLLEHGDERCCEEDRRVRAEADADEQCEGEVLERVAAEEVEGCYRGRVMKVVASERGSKSEMFPITRNDARRISGTFSRIRSKMMIVS